MNDLQTRVQSFFASHSNGVAAAYLFGSEARQTAAPDSDVDIAVLYQHDPPRTVEGLDADLQDRLQEDLGRTVDLVVLNHAAVDLVHRVLRDGILVFERDRSARIRFEVHARTMYYDLVPILERYRQAPRESRR